MNLYLVEGNQNHFVKMTPFLVFFIELVLDFEVSLLTLTFGFIDTVFEMIRAFTVLEADKGREEIAVHDSFLVC